MDSNKLSKFPALYDLKGLIQYNKSGFSHIVCSFAILLICLLLIFLYFPKHHSYENFNNSYNEFIEKYKVPKDDTIIKKISSYEKDMYDTLQKYIVTTSEYNSNLYKSQSCYGRGFSRSCNYRYDDYKIKNAKNKLLDKMTYEDLKHGVTQTQLFIYKNKKLLPSYSLDYFTRFIALVSGIWLIYNINTFKNISEKYNSSIGYNNNQSDNYFRNWLIVDFMFSIGEGVVNIIGAIIMGFLG